MERIYAIPPDAQHFHLFITDESIKAINHTLQQKVAIPMLLLS